jgi:hypothetical protein
VWHEPLSLCPGSHSINVTLHLGLKGEVHTNDLHVWHVFRPLNKDKIKIIIIKIKIIKIIKMMGVIKLIIQIMTVFLFYYILIMII